MKILVLDDDETRHKTFRQNLIGCEVTHTHTYQEAVAALEAQAFDAFHLDHDLNLDGNHVSVDANGRELSGSDFASYAAREVPEHQFPKVIVIHSYNPSGAANIASKLRRKGVRVVQEPFSSRSGESVRVWLQLDPDP